MPANARNVLVVAEQWGPNNMTPAPAFGVDGLLITARYGSICIGLFLFGGSKYCVGSVKYISVVDEERTFLLY